MIHTQARPTFDEPPAPPTGTPHAPSQDATRVRAQLAPLLLSLSILALLDAGLTLLGLAHGGHELNPLARALLAHGLSVFVAARVVLASLAALAFRTLAPKAPRVAHVCALLLVTIYGTVDLLGIFQLVVPWS